MSKLQVSPEALQDLLDIESYISIDLESPGAARSTVIKITKRIRVLADHPLMGAPLSSICNVDSDERFLVCGKYLVFYRVSYHRTDIYIDRILYGGRDYLQILFGPSGDDSRPEHDSSDVEGNPYSGFLPH